MKKSHILLWQHNTISHCVKSLFIIIYLRSQVFSDMCYRQIFFIREEMQTSLPTQADVLSFLTV